MSDKLISLESVLKEIRRFKGYIDDDMIERFSIAFKRLPAVPHEMSAREYHLIKRRMSNDMISRSHFDDRVRRIVSVDKELSADYLDGVDMVLYLLSTEPTVPQEMSAREFVATISDMCNNQFPEGCAPCPLWVAGHGCGEKILPPEDTVAIVEAWAKEHPEERSE